MKARLTIMNKEMLEAMKTEDPSAVTEKIL